MVTGVHEEGADRPLRFDPLPRSAALAVTWHLAFKPAAASWSELVAPLAAMVGAQDFGEAECTELEHLAVEMLQLVEKRAALLTEPRFEVAVLAVRDEADDRLGRHASPSASGLRA